MTSSRTWAGRHWWLTSALVLGLMCSWGAAGASAGGPADVQGAGGSEPVFSQWLPHKSYPGGAQYDPRLSAPVRFWAAGISLRDVFAQIAEQTGVAIGFGPPGDQNERVRVNLYLNRDRPPSLRALMAQLAWVTDCAFAYKRGAKESDPPSYDLLSTSIGAGAGERLEEEQQAAMADLWQQWQASVPGRNGIEARLLDYEAALRLSRDQLIALYRGVDDRLLVSLLDPTRRATVEFILSLGDEQRTELFEEQSATLDWDGLRAEQQDLLLSSLRSPADLWRGMGGPAGETDAGPAAEAWTGDQLRQVRVTGLNYGRAMVTGELERGEQGSGRRRPRFVVSPMLPLIREDQLGPDETIALRRALGETVGDQEARSLFGDWARSGREQMAARMDQSRRDEAERRIARQESLSPKARDALSAFVLPLDLAAAYALWQVQEAVAAASGMHVVSDCFSQPRISLDGPLHLLHPGMDPEMTGLLSLRLSCLSTEGVASLAWGPVADHRAGWEWQDAGSFLRFRSAARDLWRAAMVSGELLERIDVWTDPFLEEVLEGETPTGPVQVALGPEEFSQVASRLSGLQAWHGWKVSYGDPADAASVYRQSVRESILRTAAEASDILRLLATLSDHQWELLRGPGLRLSHDLTPAQQSAVTELRLGRWDETEPSGALMRLVEDRPRGARVRGGRRGPDRPGEGPAVERRYLAVWTEGEPRVVYAIPRSLTVQPVLPTPIGPATALSVD